MSQPGFPRQGAAQPRGFPQQPGPPQGWQAPPRGFPQQPGPPQGWQAPPPGWARQPWDQPRPGFPLQQPARAPGQAWSGGGGPGWQPAPRPPRRRSPIPALAVAGVILVILMVRAFSSQSGDDRVSSDYQNEDYVVPSTSDTVSGIPVPEYQSQIAEWLEDNTLYEQQLAAPVRCTVEPITNPASISDATLQRRMRSYVECLTRVWGPALEAAGRDAYLPSLYVYPAGGEVTTSCGTQESLNAFYCGADQNLYLAADVLQILPSEQAAAPEGFDLIIAHEYGHAIQGRTGIFSASHYLGEDAPSESDAREVSRRVELQADCFAGAAINSTGDSMGLGEAERARVGDISYEIGDDRLAQRFNQEIEEGDHGIAENRRLWAERGLSGDPLSSCNTFASPGTEVR